MLKQTKIGGLVKRMQMLDEVKIWVQTLTKQDVQLMIEEFIKIRLQKGEMPDGSNITNLITGDDFYKKITEIEYAKIGRRIQAGSHYTMKHTGEFFNSIDIIDVNNNDATIFGDGDKGNGVDLFEVYGENLLGLTDENYKIIKEKVLKNYLQIIRRVLLIGGGNSDL